MFYNRASRMEFTSGFKWGVSQSGFQFEMGDRYRRFIDPNTDWWHWVRDPYNISTRLVSGDLPEDGIDYLGLYKVDHENASWLGLNMYRIGVEWSRVFPYPTWFVEVEVVRDSNGFITEVKVEREDLEKLDKIANEDAVKLYREIIEDLRRRGFKVVVNLLHFTLPYWIHNPTKARNTNLGKGSRGYIEEAFPVEFAKFAAYVAYKLGDIVDLWSTMNEPMVPIELGYMAPHSGFPPGVNRPDIVPKAFLNTILAHALAYKLIKRFDNVKADPDSNEPAEVGIIHNFIPAYPVDESSSEASEHYNYFHNYMILEAIIRGRVDLALDGKTIAELPQVSRTVDWIGVNYYTRLIIKKKSEPSFPVLDFEAVPGYGYACVPFSVSRAGRWCDGMGWEMFPEGLTESISMALKYTDRIYVTENGTSDPRDISRGKFLVSHVYAVYRAIEHGMKVYGYLHWSINDNYEWPHGFRQKFGLFEVDLITKERKPRSSARIYREIALTNSLKREHLDMCIYEEKPPGSIL